MQQREYEALTGRPVDPAEYAKIERVYLAASEAFDKANFCMAMKKANTDTTSLIYDLANQVERYQIRAKDAKEALDKERTAIEGLRQQRDELGARLSEAASERNRMALQKKELCIALIKAGLEEEAVDIAGRAYIIKIKCCEGLELTEGDKEYIFDHIE